KALHRLGRWKHKAPALPTVCAAPQDAGSRINHLCISRVKREEGHGMAQIEQAPRIAAILGNVGSGHVASQQHQIGVVGADRRVEHCPTAARSQDSPGIKPGSGMGGGRKLFGEDTAPCQKNERYQGEKLNPFITEYHMLKIETVTQNHLEDEVVGASRHAHPHAAVELPFGRQVQVNSRKDLLLLVFEWIEAGDWAKGAI